MDLLIFIIVGVFVIIISKDMYIEDKHSSIRDIVNNIEETKETAVPISQKDEKDTEDTFGLSDLEDIDTKEIIGGD